jgi:hypothetical protein
MADEIGPWLGTSVPASPIDAAQLIERIERSRGTTPLIAPPSGPRISKDAVEFGARTQRLLAALANGEGDMNDPDFQRLRQLYQPPASIEGAWGESLAVFPSLPAANHSVDAERPERGSHGPTRMRGEGIFASAFNAVQDLKFALRELLL